MQSEPAAHVSVLVMSRNLADLLQRECCPLEQHAKRNIGAGHLHGRGRECAVLCGQIALYAQIAGKISWAKIANDQGPRDVDGPPAALARRQTARVGARLLTRARSLWI